MKNIFKYLLISVLTLFCFGSLYLAIVDPPLKPIVITQKQAQKTINEKMPFSKDIEIKIPIIKNKIANIFVKDAKVQFLDSGNIRITSNLNVDMEQRKASGYFDAEGEVVYIMGEFFLHNINVHKINIDDFSILEKDKEKINIGKNLISSGKRALGSFSNLLSKKAETDFEKNIAEKLSKKSIDKATSKIKANLEIKSKDFLINKLETTPIYKLDSTDIKQNIARLMLKDIKADKETLTITMSLTKLVANIWLYIFAFVCSIGILFAFLTGRVSSSYLDL